MLYREGGGMKNTTVKRLLACFISSAMMLTSSPVMTLAESAPIETDMEAEVSAEMEAENDEELQGEEELLQEEELLLDEPVEVSDALSGEAVSVPEEVDYDSLEEELIEDEVLEVEAPLEEDAAPELYDLYTEGEQETEASRENAGTEQADNVLVLGAEPVPVTLTESVTFVSFYFTPEESGWYQFYSTDIETGDPRGSVWRVEDSYLLNQVNNSTGYYGLDTKNFSVPCQLEAGKKYKMNSTDEGADDAYFKIGIKKMLHITLNPGPEGGIGEASDPVMNESDVESSVSVSVAGYTSDPIELYLNPLATVSRIMDKGKCVVPTCNSKLKLFGGWALESDPTTPLSEETPLTDGATYVAVYNDYTEYTPGDWVDIETRFGVDAGFKFAVTDTTYYHLYIQLDDSWGSSSLSGKVYIPDANVSTGVVPRCNFDVSGTEISSESLSILEGETAYVWLDTSAFRDHKNLKIAIIPDMIITLDPNGGKTYGAKADNTPDLDGGLREGRESLTFAYDHPVTLEDLKGFDGQGDYPFAGWGIRQEDGSLKLIDSTTKITQSTTLYAVYDPSQGAETITRGQGKAVDTSDNKTVTYQFTPQETGEYWIYSDIGDKIDVDPMVWIYDRYGGLLDKNDNSSYNQGYTRNFFVSINMQAGQTYYIKTSTDDQLHGTYNVYLTKVGEVQLCGDGKKIFYRGDEVTEQITVKYAIDTAGLRWDYQGYEIDDYSEDVVLLGFKDPTDASGMIENWDLSYLKNVDSWDHKLHPVYENMFYVTVDPCDASVTDRYDETDLTEAKRIKVTDGDKIDLLDDRFSVASSDVCTFIGWTDQPPVDVSGNPVEGRTALSDNAQLAEGKTYYPLMNDIRRGALQLNVLTDVQLDRGDRVRYTFTPDTDGLYYVYSAMSGDDYGYAYMEDENGEDRVSANNESSEYSNEFHLYQELKAGKTYYLYVYTYDGLVCKVGVKKLVNVKFHTATGILRSSYNIYDYIGFDYAIQLEAGKKFKEASSQIALAYVPSGMKFSGWGITGADGQIQLLSDDTVVNDDIYVEAKFDPVDTVKVTFVLGKDQDTGENVKLVQDVNAGEKMDLTPMGAYSWYYMATPGVRYLVQNKTYMGWAQSEDSKVLTSIMPEDDLILYPIFEDWIMLTIDPGDGTVIFDGNEYKEKFQVPMAGSMSLNAMLQYNEITVTPPERKEVSGWTCASRQGTLLGNSDILDEAIGELTPVYEDEKEDIVVTLDFGDHTREYEVKSGSSLVDIRYDGLSYKESTAQKLLKGFGTTEGGEEVLAFDSNTGWDSFLPTEDITLYPVWQIRDMVTIRYEDQYDSTHSEYLGRGELLSSLEILSLVKVSSDGKRPFDHWQMKKTDDASSDWVDLGSLNLTIDGPVTLRPVYSDAAITITVEAGEGNTFANMRKVKALTVKPGTRFGQLEVPALAPRADGYVFSGWTDEQGRAVTDTTELNADLVVRAVYKKGRSITLDAQGGQIYGMDARGYTDTFTFAVPTDEVVFLEDYIRDLREVGYAEYMSYGLRAWATEPGKPAKAIGRDSEGEWYLPAGQNDVTLYAIWLVDSPLVELTIDANGGKVKNVTMVGYAGGSSTTYSVSVPQGFAVSDLVLDTTWINKYFSRSGYIGTGLTLGFDGKILSEGYEVTEDTCLYVQWAKASTIILNANGGYFSEYNNNELNRLQTKVFSDVGGSELSEEKELKLYHADGKVLAGWMLRPDGEEAAVEKPIFPESGVQTYYAKWVDATPVTVGVHSTDYLIWAYDPASGRAYENILSHSFNMTTGQELKADIIELQSRSGSKQNQDMFLEGVYADEAHTVKIPIGKSEYGTLQITDGVSMAFKPLKSVELYLNIVSGVYAKFNVTDSVGTITVGDQTYGPDDRVILLPGTLLGDVKADDVSEKVTFVGWTRMPGGTEALPADTVIGENARYYAVYHTEEVVTPIEPGPGGDGNTAPKPTGNGDAAPAPAEPAGPAVGEEFTDGAAGFVYKITSDTEVSLVKYVGKKTSVTIPATASYKGKKFNVTSIAANAFKNKKKVKKVTIGKYIRTIGKNAFYGCKKLKTVTFKGKVVKKIGKNAFKKIAKKATFKTPKGKKIKAKYKKMIKKAKPSSGAKYK